MKQAGRITAFASLLLFSLLVMQAVNAPAFEFPLPPMQPIPAPEPVAGKDYVADELLVKFKDTVPEEQKIGIHERRGSNKIQEFKFIKVGHVKLEKNMSVDEAVKLYMSDTDVECAEPNIIYKFSTPPSDYPKIDFLFDMIIGI